MQGRIIVIDGMDGCGKNTQTELLFTKLEDSGFKVKMFSFPNYSDDSSYFIKKFLNGDYTNIKNPYLISLFYSIDRGITYQKEIKRLYEEGYTIILDRYYISNILYQLPNLTSYSEKMNYISFIGTVEVKELGLPVPDITIILQADSKVSDALISKRYCNDTNKRDIFENIEIQSKVNESISFIQKYKDLISFKDILGRIEVLPIHDSNDIIYTIEDMNRFIMKLL